MANDFLPWTPRQIALLPCDPYDWLAEGHLAPVLLDVVETLDLSAFHARGSETRGAAGFHPTMMVTVILYCLLRRRESARSMEHFLHDDIGARYLSGGTELPGWRCIADFRQRHRSQLASLFAQSVRCCTEAKLVDTSVVFGDGSKFAAYASRDRSVRYGQADALIAKLELAFEEVLLEADRLDEEEGKAQEAAQKRDRGA